MIDSDAAPRDRADDRALEPGAARPRARRARERARRRLAPARRLRRAGPADDLLREEPQGGRADPPLRGRAARRRRSRRGSLPTAPATRPSQRREIEQRLMAGELLGVTATDALELGIDIGSLDCAISVGFPGTVSSLRQQWGRAGRRSPGLAVLVASEDALDQYFMREPETLLAAHGRGGDPRPREPARPRRPRALRGVRRPDRRGRRGDARPGGARAGRRAARAEADRRRLRLGRHGLPGRARPAPLRRARLVHRRRRRDRRRARHWSSARARTRPSTTAPSTSTSASSTSSSALDVDARTALVTRATVDWYTQAKKETQTVDRRAAAERAAARARAPLRPRLGDRARGRLPAQVDQRRRHARDAAARPARDELRDGGDLVLPHPARSSRGSRRCRRCSPRSTRPSTR